MRVLLLGIQGRLANRIRPICTHVVSVQSLEEAVTALVRTKFDAILTADHSTNVLRQAAPHASLIAVGWNGKGCDDDIAEDEADGTIARCLAYAAERTATRMLMAESDARTTRWALQDPLTNILNRRGLEAALKRESAAAMRGDRQPTALLIDCDDFKSVNDLHGYAAGDQVLRAIANILTGTVRACDYVARIGGDEFMVLLAGTRQMEAVEVAERIRAKIAEGAGQTPVVVTASIGVHTIPTVMHSVTDLVRATQSALRTSKEQGKNRVTLAQPATPAESPVVAQTECHHVVTLGAGRVIGWEAPEIWSLQDRLKRAALPHMDLDAFRGAAADFPHGHETAAHILIAPGTLLQTPADQLLGLLPKHVAYDRLVLRLDEQFLCGDPSALRTPLDELAREGVRWVVEVEDFGRTSLESIVLLNPAMVRIASHRIRGIAQRVGTKNTLRRFLKVCDALGVRAIAAGVDRAEDQDTVSALGIDLGIGSLLEPSV